MSEAVYRQSYRRPASRRPLPLSVVLSVTTGTISVGSTPYVPTVIPDQAVGLATIGTGATPYVPSAAYLLSEATIPTSLAMYVATLAYVVLTGTIATAEAVRVPSITTTTAVTAGTISTAEVLRSPTVTPGAVVIGASHIPTTQALYAPLTGNIVIGTHIPTTVALLTPTVLPQWFIFFSFMPSTQVLHGPQVGNPVLPLSVATIGTTVALYTVTVQPDSLTLLLPRITTTGVVRPPTITYSFDVDVLLAFLSSHAVLYRPRVGEIFEFDVFTADAVFAQGLVLADALNCIPVWPRQAGDISMMLQLKRGSDQVVTLPRLRSAFDETVFIDDAEVTAQLVNGEGDVVQTAEMLHVPESDGVYVWAIDGPVFLHRTSTRYELIITAVQNQVHFMVVTPVSIID